MSEYKFMEELDRSTDMVLVELFAVILLMAPFLIGVLLLAQSLEGKGLVWH